MTIASRNEFLGEFTPAVRAVAERLAALFASIVPEAIVSVKPGWRCLAFTHPQAGYFCGVFPTGDAVRVGFEFGVLLPDPQRVLTGSGSQLRYVEIALPSEVAIRRAMVRSVQERGG